MKKTYLGSCHCGAVRYEAAHSSRAPGQAGVRLVTTTGTGSMDRYGRQLAAHLDVSSELVEAAKVGAGAFGVPWPSGTAFRRLAGKGEMADYQFGTKTGHHLFCRNCGIHPFGCGHLDVLGGDYYSINLACLDGIDPSELAEAPVRYFDGRNNNWQSPPAETRHL